MKRFFKQLFCKHNYVFIHLGYRYYPKKLRGFVVNILRCKKCLKTKAEQN